MMEEDLDRLLEWKLDELEKVMPSRDDRHFPREERRYALEQAAALEATVEGKMDTIRDITPLELYQLSMF
ncbi:hypothetical protein [Bifidobacterium sp. SO1]|uniref:hypothetical protein n=1 Tax=Bifidobacterium sp. SO1 TaxID=2809029 RepID=UPI001BDC70DF|nr:hypothetical protein [Bifidobacterium sp. SO1]MBT1162162.1 hypothetical protein [Bifidobacterium sp. SO1]